MNERSDSKTDITFELRIVENLRRSIKRKNYIVHMYGTIHMNGTIYITVHDNVHIYGTMTWY